MLERDIELEVVLRAERNGWLVRKLQWIGRRNAMDRLFIRDGRVVFVEFKKPGGSRRVTQDREIERFRKQGVECYVIDNKEVGHALFV